MDKKFIEISAVNAIRSALKAAELFRFPVLVVGEPGQGKTTALQAVAAECGAAHCEVSQAATTFKGMYRLVLEAYGCGIDKHHVAELADRLRWQLDPKDGPIARQMEYELNPSSCRRIRPLFVDEYQNLPARILRELLHYHEHSDFGLVLVGNRERLAQTRRDAAALEQIESRIGMRFRIGRPSVQDCRSISLEHRVEGLDAYAAIEAYGSRSTVRKLVRLLEVCAAQADNGAIKLTDIKIAVRLLHPDIQNPEKLLIAA